ncbi:MAG: hypothetical protein AAFY15_01620 [Cyanobacteria bacterium J06648_11]
MSSSNGNSDRLDRIERILETTVQSEANLIERMTELATLQAGNMRRVAEVIEAQSMIQRQLDRLSQEVGNVTALARRNQEMWSEAMNENIAAEIEADLEALEEEDYEEDYEDEADTE